jgi:UDP-N-acetylglucosamine 2-epimerase
MKVMVVFGARLEAITMAPLDCLDANIDTEVSSTFSLSTETYSKRQSFITGNDFI